MMNEVEVGVVLAPFCCHPCVGCGYGAWGMGRVFRVGDGYAYTQE